jgi:transaldolase
VTHDVLATLPVVGKDLDQYSLETIETFHRDAEAAGHSIAGDPRSAL